MATKFKFEIESDGLTTEQANAFSQLAKALAASTEEVGKVIKALEPLTSDYSEGVAKDIAEAVENTQKRKRASRAKAEEPTAEEPTAEEPTAEAQPEEAQPEEAQPEETKTSTFTIQDVRERVKEKQVKWRTSIKAELERLGSSSVSLLDPEHFEEFCNFMEGLA